MAEIYDYEAAEARGEYDYDTSERVEPLWPGRSALSSRRQSTRSRRCPSHERGDVVTDSPYPAAYGWLAEVVRAYLAEEIAEGTQVTVAVSP